MLHTRYLGSGSIKSSSEDQVYHWAMAKEVMERIVMNLQTFLNNCTIALEDVSPMALHSTYKVASLYVRINREIPNQESVLALGVLKDALRLKSKKWAAAGNSLTVMSRTKLTRMLRYILTNPGGSRSDELGLTNHVFATSSTKDNRVQ
jgi:hypothetical protein